MHTTTFGRRLRTTMICAGLSAPRLARRIGVSRQTVYRWLALKDPPAIVATTLIQLADAVGVSGRYLLGIEIRPSTRLRVSPNESLLIERFRNLPPADQRKLLSSTIFAR